MYIYIYISARLKKTSISKRERKNLNEIDTGAERFARSGGEKS